MAFTDFDNWQSSFEGRMKDLSKDLRVKAALKTTGQKPSAPNMNALMEDFAKNFVKEQFVEDFMWKAYTQGTGIPGARGTVSDLQDVIPRIMEGVDRKGNKTFDWNARVGTRMQRINAQFEERAAKLGSSKLAARILSAEFGKLPIEKQAKLYAQLQAKQEKLDADQEKAMQNLTHGRQTKGGAATDNVSKEKVDAAEAMGSIKSAWAQGFYSLWQGMSQVGEPRSDARGITVGVGNMKDMKSIKMNEFSVTNGGASTSEYNSFFYAAEYGTGIAENVGASFVRVVKKKGKDGLTADERGPFQGPPGSWWFSSGKHDGGGLFTGQAGLHMLYDEQSRSPRKEYGAWLKKNLPAMLNTYLMAKTGGRMGTKLGK